MMDNPFASIAPKKKPDRFSIPPGTDGTTVGGLSALKAWQTATKRHIAAIAARKFPNLSPPNQQPKQIMIVIEIPHQFPASVEWWPDDTFHARCRALCAGWDGETDCQTDKDAENIGWKLWAQDLYGAKCFESLAEAKNWADLYYRRGGHQSLKVKHLVDRLTV
jgi:hypothetical protein